MQITIMNELKKIDSKIKCTLKNSEAFQKDEDLTRAQGYIIGFIYRKTCNGEDVFQKNMEIAFKISKATISELLLNMEQKGYIERITYEKDARYKKIVLTELGLKKQTIVNDELGIIQDKMLIDFTKEEKEQLLSFLLRMESKL